MTVYKKFLTIENPQQLILSDLPFQPGQKVEIVIFSQELDRSILVQELKDLLRETQFLLSSQSITEEEIQAEIDVTVFN